MHLGIKVGGSFYSAYSATNGNIWLPIAAGSVNWADAEIRIRTATGEQIMPGAGNAGCNRCQGTGNGTLQP